MKAALQIEVSFKNGREIIQRYDTISFFFYRKNEEEIVRLLILNFQTRGQERISIELTRHG